MYLGKYSFCNLWLFKVYINIRKMLQNSDMEIASKQFNPLCHTIADLVKFFCPESHSVNLPILF